MTRILTAQGKPWGVVDGDLKIAGKDFYSNFEGNYSGSASLSYTDDQFYYFVDGTTPGNIKFTFNYGALYGKDVKGASFTLPEMSSLEKNHSYIIKIKIKPLPLYLFNDGVVGTLAEHTNRLPIGVVAEEKTPENGNTGLAIALRNANPVADDNAEGLLPWATSPWDKKQANRDMSGDFFRNINDMSGYEWTWGPNHSKATKAHAHDFQYFPAFYAAAHYMAINVDGFSEEGRVGKWFLPSLGQWMTFAKKVMKLKVNEFNDLKHVTYSAKCPPAVIDKWFTDAKTGYGQPLIGTQTVKEYWSSTQCNCTINELAEKVCFSSNTGRAVTAYPYGVRFVPSSLPGLVRPFVKF